MLNDINLSKIYNKLQTYINQPDKFYQVYDLSLKNKKDKIYLHVANILRNKIGDDLFKPLYWRRNLTQCQISGIDLPHSLGGLNLHYVEIIEIFCLFGIIDLNLRDVPGVGHARILIKHNNKFSTVLNGILNAKEYVAIAITEEGSGSDLYGLKTVATPVNNGYILDGKKCFIARIEEASYFIVFSYVIREKSDKKLTALLVPKNQINVIHRSMSCTGFIRGQLGEN